MLNDNYKNLFPNNLGSNAYISDIAKKSHKNNEIQNEQNKKFKVYFPKYDGKIYDPTINKALNILKQNEEQIIKDIHKINNNINLLKNETSMNNVNNIHDLNKEKKKIEDKIKALEKEKSLFIEKLEEIKNRRNSMNYQQEKELGIIEKNKKLKLKKFIDDLNNKEKNEIIEEKIKKIQEDSKKLQLKMKSDLEEVINKKNFKMDQLEKEKEDKIKKYLNDMKEEEKKYIKSLRCYICKEKFTPDNIHKFYGNLCTKCGDHNYSYRTIKLDLSGRIAIVTGGRVKIGYYISTKLLSYGCKVIITTRFPKDSLIKYQQDPDYEKWKDNLIIYPIDFRIFESTIKFINYIKENFTHIDILINNAAQTLRRSSSYYNYLLPIEATEVNKENDKKIIKEDYISIQNSNPKIIVNKQEILNSLIPLENTKSINFQETLPLSVITSQIKIMEEKDQPSVTKMGSDDQPYDFAGGKNSWNFEFDEIPFQEFTEVQIINAWTPYYLCSKLKPLMEKSPFQDKYIVNVTAVEGIFNHYKRTTHVHTNMAKAALNMFTRTCGKYLKNIGIYMTCVDTGWVNYMDEMTKLIDENEKEFYENKFTNIPLDELDGAMRVLQPIIEGIKNKNYLYGILLKNYTTSVW
jgi:NAD(P)-dependent dehydrogenase (short-subunit alcohol dehydrogenase family)